MFLKSHYSIKYGILSPEELIQWAKGANYKQVVLCDINSTTSSLSYVREAQKLGMPAVIGIDIRNGMDCCYLLIAKNNRGLHEANEFISTYLHQQKPFPTQAPNLGN